MSCCSLFSSCKPLYLLAQRAASRARQGGPSSRILSPFFRTLFTKADHFAGFCAQARGGFFLDFLCTIFNTASSAATQVPLILRMPGIEPRTVATTALAVRRSTTRQDLIHTLLDLIHARLDLIHTRLDLIHSRLDLIPTQLNLIHGK